MYLVTKNKQGYNVAYGDVTKDKRSFINSFGSITRIGFDTVLFDTIDKALTFIKGKLNG